MVIIGNGVCEKMEENEACDNVYFEQQCGIGWFLFRLNPDYAKFW